MTDDTDQTLEYMDKMYPELRETIVANIISSDMQRQNT